MNATQRHNKSNAQRMAVKRYRHKTMAVGFRVNPRTEPELYRKLASVPCVAAYLKALVMRDIGA